MRASRASLVLVLSLLPAAGCPPAPVPPALVPSPAASAAVASATVSSQTATSAGERRELEVTVRDERGRPVAGAVVWLHGEKPLAAPPAEPVLLEQKDLEFRPAFLVARKGQTLRVHNADAELHNVHSSAPCCSWNVSILAGGDDSRRLDEAGESTFLCDIHSHMRCVLLVLDADFARTGADGRARLSATPGVHKLHVQALDRPRSRSEVTVEPSGPASVAVTLEASPPSPSVQAPERLPWTVVASRLGAALADAERWASLGDAGSAREAADEALGRWYSGSGLYEALRELDATQVAQGDASARGRADELKSALRKRCARAESVAGADPASRPALLEKLHAEDSALAVQLADLARALPRRDRPKGDRP